MEINSDVRNNRIHRLIAYLLSWGLIPMIYLSWCFSTISYKNHLFGYVSGAVAVVSALVYIFLICNKGGYTDSREDEIDILSAVIIIGGVLFLFIIMKEYEPGLRLPAVFGTLFWIAAAAVWFVKNPIEGIFLGCIEWIKEHVLLLVLMAATVLLSIDQNMYQFKWDGRLYYTAVDAARLSSVSSVALYGHIAMSSGAIYRFFASLIGNVGYGMVVANIVVLLIGIAGFYGCVKTICPDQKEIGYILATACYAFSPFALGMVNYFSTDWFCVCLSTVFVYYVLKRKWIMTTILACIFCMTKEPSLMAYAGFCLGLVLYDLISSGDFKKGFLGLFKTWHYYFMLIPLFLWVLTHKILGTWSAGNGGFELDTAYMIEKIKVFYIFNFNWIITLIIVFGLIMLIARKELKEQLWWLLPIVCSDFFLLLLNLAFKTVNHARYIDSFISLRIIIATVFVLKVYSKPAIKNTVLAVWALVCLISCMTCIDPVSMALFDKNNVGNTYLLSTGERVYNDSSVYNKQLLWMEEPMDRAISASLKDGSAVVMMVDDEKIYSTDGMSEDNYLTDGVNAETQYWDPAKEVRVCYVDENVLKATPFTMYHAADGVFVDNACPGEDSISVIYIKGLNNYIISDAYALDSSEDYSYRGWVISRDRYSMK